MLINSCSDDRILPSPDAAVDQSVGAFSKVEWVDLKELIPTLYLQRAAKKLRTAEQRVKVEAVYALILYADTDLFRSETTLHIQHLAHDYVESGVWRRSSLIPI